MKVLLLILLLITGCVFPVQNCTINCTKAWAYCNYSVLNQSSSNKFPRVLIGKRFKIKVIE